MKHLRCGRHCCEHYTCIRYIILLVATIIFSFYSQGNWGTFSRGAKEHTVIRGQSRGLDLRRWPTLTTTFSGLFRLHHQSWSQWDRCGFYFTELRKSHWDILTWVYHHCKNPGLSPQKPNVSRVSLFIFTNFGNTPLNLFFLAECFWLSPILSMKPFLARSSLQDFSLLYTYTTPPR